MEGGLTIKENPDRKKSREGWEAAFDRALSGQAQTLSQEDRDWLDADLVDDQRRTPESPNDLGVQA